MTDIQQTEPVLPAAVPLPRQDSPLRRLARRPAAVFGAAVLLFFAVCALWPVGLLPHDPARGDQGARLLPPAFVVGGSGAHLLGTDALGRDIASMLVAGTRATLLIVLCASAIGLLIGVVAGLCAGYFGGWVDALTMRLVDVQLAFPAIVLIIAVVAAFGPSTRNLILILGVIGWAPYARLVRGTVLSLRRQEFVTAAEIAGVGRGRTIFRHLMPNAATSVIIFLTAEMARLVLLEASLSFLGLGVQPPAPSWGLMIAEARQYIYESWWAATLPGLAIVLTVLALNFFGDEIRDVLDPRSGKGRS